MLNRIQIGARMEKMKRTIRPLDLLPFGLKRTGFILTVAGCVMAAPHARPKAKPFILWGMVKDAKTLQILPYANVRIVGSTAGAAANKEGFYALLLSDSLQKTAFSYIGYLSDTLSIPYSGRDAHYNVFLKPSAVPMQEVRIIGRDLNPARRIISRAIIKKREIVSQLKNYQFSAYSKSVLFVPKKGSTSNDTVTVGILETQSLGYWQVPDQYKEIITARRQTANFASSQNIFSVGPIPNLNDDVVVIERNRVVGPTAHNAFAFYDFEMVDTAYIDHIPVFRIRLLPKSDAVPLFRGTIRIADSSFMVMEADVLGNDAFDLGTVREMRYRENFALYEDKFWLPIEVRIHCIIPLPFPGLPPIRMEQVSLIHGYRINESIPARLFDEYQISVSPEADRVDTTAWGLKQRIPLTHEETAAYIRLDSLVSHASPLRKGILFLSRAPIYLKQLPLVAFEDLYHFNRAEGSMVGIGLDSKDRFPSVHIRASAGYGTQDHAWKYRGALESFFLHKRMGLGVEAIRQIEAQDVISPYGPNERSFYCLFYKNDPCDYFLNRGKSVFAAWRPSSEASFTVRYLEENHNSAKVVSDFSFFYPSRQYRQNPDIQPGRLRALRLEFRMDTRQWIDAGWFDSRVEGKPSWNVEGCLEYTDKYFLHSGFQYTQAFVHVERHQPTFAAAYLDADLRAGTSTGGLPDQRFFRLPGSTEDFVPTGAFRTVRCQEFGGDRILSIWAEHHCGALPFKALHLPWLRRRNLDFIVMGGAGWTGGPATMDRPVAEAGFGIGRFFGMLRFDFVWRISRTGMERLAMNMDLSM
jgi:hypothetical protein